MKQRSPVHFVAGFFQRIAPNAQRMRRQTECRGVLGMAHAAPVHRLDMHAPERSKSNRFAVRAHAVAIARRPFASLRWPLLALPFKLFAAQFPQVFRAFAQILRANQMAHPPFECRDRKLAPAAIFLRFLMAAIPGRNVCRPVRIVGLCPGAAKRHRRFSTAAENLKWNENKICERRAGFGRLRLQAISHKIETLRDSASLASRIRFPTGTPTNEIKYMRTTKERLDFALRTTRSVPLRTTRFPHLAELLRKFGSNFV
jgi:hypothetical protein